LMSYGEIYRVACGIWAGLFNGIMVKKKKKWWLWWKEGEDIWVKLMRRLLEFLLGKACMNVLAVIYGSFVITSSLTNYYS
jgi:hypothetical protein